MKKVIAILFVTVILSLISLIPASAESYRIGDVNTDGARDAGDLVSLKTAILTSEACTEMKDVNEDGILDIRDLIRLKKYLVSEDSSVSGITQGSTEIVDNWN